MLLSKKRVQLNQPKNFLSLNLAKAIKRQKSGLITSKKFPITFYPSGQMRKTRKEFSLFSTKEFFYLASSAYVTSRTQRLDLLKLGLNLVTKLML